MDTAQDMQAVMHVTRYPCCCQHKAVKWLLPPVGPYACLSILGAKAGLVTSLSKGRLSLGLIMQETCSM